MTRNYVYHYETGSMTGILGRFKWESLKKRRKDNRLILLYKGLKGKARIPTDDLIPKTRRGRNQHSLAFQIPSASKDFYKYSIFPQTIRDSSMRRFKRVPKTSVLSKNKKNITIFHPKIIIFTVVKDRSYFCIGVLQHVL